MQWDTGRQIQYALGLIVILAVVGVGGYFGLVYKAPSCTDNIQNGTEEGIDCGGTMCTNLCASQAPHVSVVWARSVKVADGVYHAVAMVRNPDTGAAGAAPYKVSLFDKDNILIVTREGTLTLAPGDVIPLFEANIPTGNRIPARTFVEIGSGTWAKAARAASPIRVIPTGSADEANTTHSLSASVENTSPEVIPSVTVTALLYDASSTLVAASQTTVDQLGAREIRNIVFTWQASFPAPAATFDLIPRLPVQAGVP
jgi:hypothetical protein